VSSYTGMKLPAVRALARKAGVLVNATTAVSGVVAAGKVVDQVQPPGTQLPNGSTLEVVVSLGEPQLAFDNGADIFTADGYNGAHKRAVATTGDRETEPAWNPQGTLIAYRRGPKDGSQARIYVVAPGKPGTARPLTDAGADDHRPAFSPNGLVVAFARRLLDRSGANLQLCFKRLHSSTQVPACKPNPGVDVTDPTWSRDGKTIYVLGQKTDDGQPVQIWAYHSDVANSSRPSTWSVVGAVSAPFEGKTAGGSAPQVTMVSADPSDDVLGFTANWHTGVTRLWTARIQADGSLAKARAVRAGRIAACEFSWRLDGQEVVYTRADAACNETGEIDRVDVNQGSPVQITKVGYGSPAWTLRPPDVPAG
jgi:Tol biopolymer transport system component